MLVEYFWQEWVLHIDAIKECLLGSFSVITELRQLFSSWDSTPHVLLLTFSKTWAMKAED